ncbi:hypothetical protein CC85DRAFT_266265 [Cutaneotrichosporon oleaginosum]|uniref:Cora-domain-containing protein n=1 Tax=Cutaneotrichosporon oleaginosum TaxID=879819 RepID=A0A0J0XD66_9TREE|nr:uncharacterized protein CC85DRAFT_266265 [Cutaneotrichosporon oleaginosum]KLT38988.1 hypothetical protein CC85DRAFT_266265 [Cutaneotrichosporon oleaginosum]TXT14658.1 hypothetical protein COLE_00851 [Cutaneotrichosporon oleaginosum]
MAPSSPVPSPPLPPAFSPHLTASPQSIEERDITDLPLDVEEHVCMRDPAPLPVVAAGPSPLHPPEPREPPRKHPREPAPLYPREPTKAHPLQPRSPHFAPLPGGTHVAPSSSTPARLHVSATRPRVPLTPIPTYSTTAGTAPPTPILAQTPAPHSADQPEFAELLTPAQLRRRRRPRAALADDAPAGMGTLAGQPLLAGPSRHGWTTDDGDLYRGATSDPTPEPALPLVSNDDAITVSSGSSGSSSWSWGSGGVAGATRAVVQRIGGAIGVRRGSTSSMDTGSSSSSSSSSSSDGAATRVIGRLGRALTRTVSRATVDSTEERPRRIHVPRRREFTLLLPDENWAPGEGTPMPTPPLPAGGTPAPTPNRLITTPVLQPILDEVRKARQAAGITSDLAVRPAHTRKGVAMKRGGSAPGRSRQPRTFTAPPPRRPIVPRTLTRLEALRGTASIPIPVRPKSASDLLGMVGPRSASATSLRGLVDEPEPLTPSPQMSIDTMAPKPRAAWWLDVSCPTWKDLRDIGELLSLHPLTLEDVLHQDPREKLDTFDALGYYFVAVRALDEQYFKYTPGSVDAPPGAEITTPGHHVEEHEHAGPEKKKERQRRGWGFGRATGRTASKAGEKVEIVEDHPGKEGLEGVAVGGINLYLAVFADGIVSFHYGDVAKHTARVRDRVLSVPTHEPTADWIAHGLLDSIVDAFFPLTGYVDGAVDDMDSLTIDPTRDPRDHSRAFHIDAESPADAPYADHIENFTGGDKDVEWIAMENTGLRERRKSRREMFVKQMNRAHTNARQSGASRYIKKIVVKAFARSRLDGYTATSPLAKGVLYAKLFFLPITEARPKQYMPAAPEVFDRTTVLNSMTNLRRLVTGLSRLLGGKHMVVASLLKRVENHGTSDVQAYLSDVHDHILLLQTSLYHYEYILANCQPAYISYLQVSGSTSRGNISNLVLALSVVTIGILPMQFVTSSFSLNVHVPHNHIPEENEEGIMPRHPRNYYFAGVVIGVFLVACTLVTVIRWWRWKARVKWSRIRGVEVPRAWDGFWGWE